MSPSEHQAPWFSIPSRSLITVEHPCIVKDVDRALETLDTSTVGNDIAHALNYQRTDNANSALHLLLNPDDKMSRSVASTCAPTNNVLLKVTVPKMTGRRRKRGSDGSFEEYRETLRAKSRRMDAKSLLRSLQDNVGEYNVEAIGRVDRSHVFRGMPDFVFSTTQSPFINKFRECILPFEYTKLKNFDIDMAKGQIKDVDIVPPPTLSRGDIPFTYLYRQNLAVKQSVTKSGQITTINIQQPNRVLTHLVPFDIAEVPSAPHQDCPPLEEVDQDVKDTVKTLSVLFETRAAWTRRALRNSLPTEEQKQALRHAIPHVAYVFRSGPWRDAIVRFNYDPRKDKEAHIYQTFMFRILATYEKDTAKDVGSDGLATAPVIATTIVSNRRNTYTRPSATAVSTLSNSHIFTGKPPIYHDGKMWM
ncbi:tau 95 subunit of transcription factor TFIIIC, partial [Ascosphaera aggregata]